MKMRRQTAAVNVISQSRDMFAIVLRRICMERNPTLLLSISTTQRLSHVRKTLLTIAAIVDFSCSPD